MHLFISNSRKKLKIFLVAALSFVLCYEILVHFLVLTWRPRENLFYFYQYKDTQFDVLNIGSSHAYCSLNTIELYRNTGITSYNLAAGSQPVWFSYFYLKEALKTQKPKVVVLDVYMTRATDEENFERVTQLNILTMKPSLNKLEALKVSGTDNVWNIFWGFPQIHARYRELTSEEYCNDIHRNMMGYDYKISVEPKNNKDVLDANSVTDILPISEKSEEYLRKIADLCKENNINLVLVNSPYANVTREDQCYFNYVGQLADEMGTVFLDGNKVYEKIGIDYLMDNGKDGHLSYTGSVKWTSYIADYITKHFSLEDHRSEHSQIWEESVDALDNMLIKERLQNTKNSYEYFEYLDKQTPLPYLAIVQTSNIQEEEEFQETGLHIQGEERAYRLRLPDGEIVLQDEIYSDSNLYAAIYNSMRNCKSKDSAYKNMLLQYTKDIDDNRMKGGICFVVFDPHSYELLDFVEFSEDGSYKNRYADVIEE